MPYNEAKSNWSLLHLQCQLNFRFMQGSHSDWKTWKMRRHFPVRDKSDNLNRLEKSGKIIQNTGKMKKFQILFDIFSNILINCVLFA